MTTSLLLDTCALIWLLNGDRMSENSIDAIETAAENARLFVSAISAWEVATLERKGRLAFAMPVSTWFERAEALPGLAVTPLTPRILIASADLPGRAPSDPADRMIIAASRELGASVVTRDRAILDYAGQGYLAALEC